MMLADYRFLRVCGAGRVQAFFIAIRKAWHSRKARKARGRRGVR